MRVKKALFYLAMCMMGITVVYGLGTYFLSTPANSETLLEKNNRKQIQCLATNIYFEANNQPFVEKQAIAHVVLNRVKDKHFPNTICEVVYQAVLDSNGNPILNKCQFSWYCDGKSERILDFDGYQEAFNVAEYVIEIQPKDITEGSLWYHAVYVNPRWAKDYVKIARIDTHIFYRR